MPQLARRMGRAKQSAIMPVAEKVRQRKAQGRDIIGFSIGVPNFSCTCPEARLAPGLQRVRECFADRA